MIEYAAPLMCLSLLIFGGCLATIQRQFNQWKQAQFTPAQIKKMAADKALFNAIYKEAKELSEKIPEALGIQGFSNNWHENRNDRRGRRRRKSLVKFDAALLTRTEIWFHIDGSKLPYRVRFSDLENENNAVLHNLQRVIHRPMMFQEDNQFNLFLRVGLKNSIMGVPKQVFWADIFEKLPANKPFAVGVGVSQYNRLVWQDLREWPHGIVAGATKQGKSTQLNQWIITLAKRNSPSSCHFYFVDLKEGVEFHMFESLSHTQKFVEEVDDVLPVIEKLQGIYKQRMKQYKASGYRSIREWNQHQPQKHATIFLIVDEIADLMLNKKLGNAASEKMGDLARKARAAGIHMILATQILEARVLNLQIRGNFAGRCIFSLSGTTESVLALNNGLAVNLGHVGRCVYRDGAKHMILQAPIATREEIQETIAECSEPVVADDAAGAADPATAPLTNAPEILVVAWRQLDGRAGWREIYDAMNGEIGQKRLKAALKILEYDGTQETVFLIDGEQVILQAGDNNTPRKLVKFGTGQRGAGRGATVEEDVGQGAGQGDELMLLALPMSVEGTRGAGQEI